MLRAGVSQVITNDKVFAEDTDNNGSVEKFDKYKGHQVYEYSVQNKSGLKISVLNQGGTLHGIYVPNGMMTSRISCCLLNILNSTTVRMRKHCMLASKLDGWESYSQW